VVGGKKSLVPRKESGGAFSHSFLVPFRTGTSAAFATKSVCAPPDVWQKFLLEGGSVRRVIVSQTHTQKTAWINSAVKAHHSFAHKAKAHLPTPRIEQGVNAPSFPAAPIPFQRSTAEVLLFKIPFEKILSCCTKR